MKQESSSFNDSSPVQSPDQKNEKRELMARLDEMKRAIDGYKDYKLKSSLTSNYDSDNKCHNYNTNNNVS